MKKTITSLFAAAAAMGLAMAASPAAAGVIGIQFAAYGAKDDPQLPPADVGHLPMQSASVNSIVTNMCQGQVSCTVPADNQHLGDPAPMHAKKLWISFNCSGLVQPLASVDEGHALTISCPQAAAPAAPQAVVISDTWVETPGAVSAAFVAPSKTLFDSKCAGKADCTFTFHRADLGTARTVPYTMVVYWNCATPDHSRKTQMSPAMMNDGQSFHFVCPH